MGMSSYVMDCEDKFLDEVSARIGECEHIEELMASLLKDDCFDLVKHVPEHEIDAWVDELWNDYWSEYASAV